MIILQQQTRIGTGTFNLLNDVGLYTINFNNAWCGDTQTNSKNEQ